MSRLVLVALPVILVMFFFGDDADTDADVHDDDGDDF